MAFRPDLLVPLNHFKKACSDMIATIRASIRADIPSIANDQDFGMIMALFLWVYALLSPIGGFIADRFNRRWTVIGSSKATLSPFFQLRRMIA